MNNKATRRAARAALLLASLMLGPIAVAAGPNSFMVDVVDAWHGGLIVGAKVQLLDARGKVQFEGVTDKQGHSEASAVASGRYTLVITARGCRRFERKNFAVPTQGTFEADVTPDGDDD
jgi:Carboxypeptidase regulatory-like domain